ncbi:pentapeptide repeat-containing protein [Streptomyces sp. NPDC060187]|uniref:pentapeptide repeat-containing protein n=1 Tax=Streptomyces sp. NPDC060187 TaxID=3347067 RepID=UPI00365D99EF
MALVAELASSFRAHSAQNVAKLTNADLSCTNLSGADLNGVHLTHVTLRRANLTGADLNGADLTEADLGNGDLSGADLCDANLNGANLIHVMWSEQTQWSPAIAGEMRRRSVPIGDGRHQVRGPGRSGADLDGSPVPVS